MQTEMTADQQVISMSQLGRYGRFGNQFFQYAFLKIYAKEHGCMLELPAAWVGRRLFNVDNPPMSRALPSFTTKNWIQEGEPSLEGKDVLGYFQHPTQHYAPHKEYFRSLFRPRPKIEASLNAQWQAIRNRGKTVVTLHLRRGDFGYGIFWIAPSQWYLSWLEEAWKTFDDPVLVIISDEPMKVLPDFAKYNPVTFQNAPRLFPGAEFYPDFWAMTQADVLAISNSTYSFAASMLNERCKLFMRPEAFERKLISYDPWNAASTLDGPPV
jgi:hypothetical protein